MSIPPFEWDSAKAASNLTAPNMKKANSRLGTDDLRPEYDFDYSKAKPNPYAARLKGHTVAVLLAPDVATAFPTSEGEMTSNASWGRPDGFLGLLRTVALIAMVAGAAGSVGVLLNAGRRTPLFLLVLFVGWVLSPFIVLGWAHTVSERWSVLTRATLYWLTLVLALGSLAVYYWDPVLRPAGSSRAALFVVVAPASWLLIGIALSTAAWIARRRSRRVAEQPGT